jgi:hypothetical protein
MSYNQQTYKLIDRRSMTGLSGPQAYITPALDLRFVGGSQRIGRLVSVMLYHDGVEVFTDEILQWAGGATSAQWQPGESDIYEFMGTDKTLIQDDNSASGVLVVVPMPTILTPFVRFRLQVNNLSPAANYSMWALAQVSLNG